MLTIRHLTFANTAPLAVLLNISGSSDRRCIILLPLESPHRGESNGGKIMFLGAIDGEIFNAMLSGAVFANVKCRIVDISSYILPSIAPRNMFLPSFDSPRRGDSNGGKIMFLQSLNPELFSKMPSSFGISVNRFG